MTITDNPPAYEYTIVKYVTTSYHMKFGADDWASAQRMAWAVPVCEWENNFRRFELDRFEFEEPHEPSNEVSPDTPPSVEQS